MNAAIEQILALWDASGEDKVKMRGYLTARSSHYIFGLADNAQSNEVLDKIRHDQAT
jgi:hypothetical protein